MSDGPFCKDCKFLRTYIGGHPPECWRPTKPAFDLVRGEKYTYSSFDPHRERSGTRTLFGRQKCGPGGVFFQQSRFSPLPPPSK